VVQLSITVAVPNAAEIWAAVGLQVSVPAAVSVMVGAVWSNVQVAVRVFGIATLPQASVAFQVRVWLYWQPLTTTSAVVMTGVTVPQLSVTVAVPRAASI
jgi:hypothetical protein